MGQASRGSMQRDIKIGTLTTACHQLLGPNRPLCTPPHMTASSPSPGQALPGDCLTNKGERSPRLGVPTRDTQC